MSPAPDAVQVKSEGSGVESLHERGITWVSFKPIPDLACGIDFALRKSPELGLLSGTVQGVRHEHARRNSGDGDDDFSLHLNVSGLSLVAGQRGETELRGGDAMLLSYSMSRTISRPGPVDHRVLRLPRAVLAPLVPDIDRAVLCRIPRGTGMLRLLGGYIDAVFDDPALAEPQVRRLVAAQLCDLVAVTLGAPRAMPSRSPKDAASAQPGYAPSRPTSRPISRPAISRPAQWRSASAYRTATSESCSRAKQRRSLSLSSAAASSARIAD